MGGDPVLAFSNDSPLGTFLAVVAEIRGPSDKLAATTAGAACERAVRQFLLAHDQGASGSFKDCIDRCRQRGLIDDQLADALHALREIRNEAVHNEAPLDLAKWEPRVRELVLAIDPARFANQIDPKAEFRAFALWANGVLRWMAVQARNGGIVALPLSLHAVVGSVRNAMTGPVVLLVGLAVIVLAALHLQGRARSDL